MHILILTDEIYPDAVGGVSKSITPLGIEWVAQGHKVTVVVRRINNTLPTHENMKGMEVVRFTGPARHNWYYHMYPLWIVWHVTRWLRKHPTNFDLIFLNSSLYMVPVFLASISMIPVVFNLHASLMHEIRIGADRNQYGRMARIARLVGLVFHWIEARALRRATHNIVDGHQMLADLRKLHGPDCFDNKSSVIDLGVNTDFYQPINQHSARIQLNLPPDKKILFTARRLVGRVGLSNLIRAMPTVSDNHPDVLLLIAGKGFLRPVLEDLIAELGLEDKITLLGFVAEEDLPIYMSAADLFVLPTELLEGFGVATIEALACGLPVVGTPIGTTPELLAPITPDLITADPSPAALAKTIDHWLSRPSELRSLRHACRQIAENRFSISVIANQLINLFEQYTSHSNKQ